MILWFFLALFLISCFLLGWLLWPFISIIVLAAVITGIFNPVYRYLNRRLSPIPSSLLTCLLIFLVHKAKKITLEAFKALREKPSAGMTS